MKPYEAKAIVTAVAWIALSIVSVMAVIFANGSNIEDWALVAMALGPLGIAVATTAIIWDQKDSVQTSDSAQDQQYEKAKRTGRGQSRLDMLMDMMDEDEREAFKETLKEQVLRDFRQGNISEDGELPTSLASLMEDEGRQRYR